jgi:acetylornithine/N-succinyldiaminopimelate aminotransferase
MVTTEFNDVDALERTLSREFAAVIVEVVQGEGGLSVMSREFADAIGRLAQEHGVTVIADEVQTGLGRTGRFYASELVGLEADIITLAKPLAAGLPLSATMIPAEINDALHVGDHGTTFGGGPVTTAVALRVLDVLSDRGFLSEVRRKGDHLRRRLTELSEKLPLAGRVLGHGLLTGIEVGESDDGSTVGELMGRCQDAGLLVLKSGVNALRLAPPLVITDAEIDEALSIIETAMIDLAKE